MLDNREEIDGFTMALASASWARPVPYIARFAEGARPLAILFDTAALASGHVLVARAERAIAGILFGGDEDDVVQQLAGHFPGAKLSRDNLNSCRVIANVLALVANPMTGVEYEAQCEADH